MFTCACLCVHAVTYAYVHICACVSVYATVYACISVYVHTYIHEHLYGSVCVGLLYHDSFYSQSSLYYDVLTCLDARMTDSRMMCQFVDSHNPVECRSPFHVDSTLRRVPM